MTRRLLLALLLGLAIGVATSYGQEDLGVHWQALANAASPWLLGAFVGGGLQRDRAAGVAAGLLACLGEVLGYYGIAPVRGFANYGPAVAFWTVCAAVGGPTFGWAGWAWRHGSERWRAVGAAALPATFLAEAVGTYALRLHYRGDAVLFAVIGLVLAVAVASALPRWWRIVVPFVAVSALGIIAYAWVLDAASRAAFGA